MMLNVLRWSALMGLSLLILLSCSEPKTHQYFMTHPKAIAATLTACQRDNLTTEPCRAASRARDDVSRLLGQLMVDQEGFGFHILDLQMRMGTQQKAYEKASQQLKTLPETKKAERAALQAKRLKLQTQLKRDKALLAQRLAIVRLTESPNE